MATIHELATMLKELDDQLTNCMKCGMCQAVCPLFGQTMFEADVARGKLALLEGLAHEILKDPAGVNEKLQRCLLCGTCEKNCPSGVHVIDIFLKARAILTGYFGLSPAKRVIFRQLLTRPKTFNMLLSIGGKFQGFSPSPQTRSWVRRARAFRRPSSRTGIFPISRQSPSTSRCRI